MSTQELGRLVNAGSTERVIRSYFLKNLNILGSICAPSQIMDEYIAFSEFPILEGKADFVVFTDRSRMVIVIVEIKGADFNFLNGDGSVNSEINKAAQQIRERYSAIEDNYEMYRRKFHEIRRDVESGSIRYSSCLGPAGHLEVSSEKDIWLKGLVIGGRTTDDLKVSRARHLLEKESHRISFDTWDSFIKNNGYYGNQLRTYNL